MERLPIKQILKWTGYPAIFLLCFVFFAYKTFPYDRLADRLVQEARARGYDLEIIDLTHSGLTGLTFENVRIVMPPEGEDSTPLDVILDELTVGLDTTSAAVVTDAIDKLIEGRTAILITHKLSSASIADRLIVLSNGRIAEQGTYEELLEKGGIFAGLHRNQGSFAL